MAMACHSLGTIYHLCLMLTSETVFDGFTPAYLGRIGFFLFFIAASYGQMDRIIDTQYPREFVFVSLILKIFKKSFRAKTNARTL